MRFFSSSNITVTMKDVSNSIPAHYFVATDADSAAFGRVSYGIVSNYDPYMFRLDATKGKTYGSRQATESCLGALLLLRMPPSRTVLVVRATDGDEVPRFTDQVFTLLPDKSSARWTYFGSRASEVTLLKNAPIGTTMANFKASGTGYSSMSVM